MQHVVLIGDSIFDNGPYVEKGESVSEVLSVMLKESAKVTLFAVDGDVTTDVPLQLEPFPDDVTHAFVSCGGNDALRILNILNQSVSSVGDALESLADVRKTFRINYTNMLRAISDKVEKLTVCTIYNSVPGTSDRALAALALFNEIILEEAVALRLPIIDLRCICLEYEDYSVVSPIEPSGQGAKKISKVITYVLSNHNYESKVSAVYI
jgi:hypothetical protein